MDGVGVVLEVSMNWNPSYSYSSLPDGYSYENIPSHWKTMLQKVEPPEKGIPEFKDVHVSRLKVSGAKRALSVSGTKESIVKAFRLKDVEIEAGSAGKVSFAEGWELENVSIKSGDGKKLSIENCSDMKL
jgi:hypothetical protein